jgi:hypothetical protein
LKCGKSDLSGDFEPYWEYHVRQDQQRLHPKEALDRRPKVATPIRISSRLRVFDLASAFAHPACLPQVCEGALDSLATHALESTGLADTGPFSREESTMPKSRPPYPSWCVPGGSEARGTVA